MAVNYILRLDDVAPNMDWENFDRLRLAVEHLGVFPLAAVVPDNRDPFLLSYPPPPGNFWGEIRELDERGWKIAMHGYQHLPNTLNGGTLGLNRQSEFAGLPFEDQLERVTSGRDALLDRRIRTNAFVAPWHSYDRDTERALLECGFEAMSDGFALYPYEANGLTHVPQLFAARARPPIPIGVWTICLHLNTMSRGDLGRALSFVERKRSRFITFDDAVKMVSRSAVNRVAGVLARGIGVSAATLAGHRRQV
ncbi:MAG: DUF2334 domain-containing protein [Candidatus Eisenbacteria bacterium]